MRLQRGEGVAGVLGNLPRDPPGDTVDRAVVGVERVIPSTELLVPPALVGLNQPKDLGEPFVEMVAADPLMPAPESRLGGERRAHQGPEFGRGILDHAHGKPRGACSRARRTSAIIRAVRSAGFSVLAIA